MRYSILLICVLYSATSGAQTPAWVRADGFGSTSVESFNSITTDKWGNIIAIGFFTSPTMTIGSFTVSNSGMGNIVVAKFDPAGNALWAITLMENYYDILGQYVSTDANGNIFISGQFMSPSLKIGNTTITNSNPSTLETYIAKLDPSGNCLWAKKDAGSDRDYCHGITIDPGGNPITLIDFQSNTLTIGTTVLTKKGESDAAIIKRDPSGNLTWVIQLGDTGYTRITEATTDAAGNIYAAGEYYNSPLTIGSTVLPLASLSGNLFLAKFSSSGNFLWAQPITSGGSGCGANNRSILVNSSGDIFLSGTYLASQLYFGSIQLPNNSSANNYYRDVFLAKYSNNGQIKWAKNFTGLIDENEEITASTFDANGNILLAGQFRGQKINFGTTILTNNGFDGYSADVYIAGLDTAGTPLWAISAGGLLDDSLSSIATDIWEDIYVAGQFFSPNLSFGTLPALTNNGTFGSDAWLAKLSTTPVAVQEEGTNPGFSISPNPVKENAVLSFSEALINATLSIYDLTGRKIFSDVLSGKKYLLKINTLQPGIYAVCIIDNNGASFTEKIVVQ